MSSNRVRVQITRLRDDGKVITDQPDGLLEPANLLPLGHVEYRSLRATGKDKPKPVEMRRLQATDHLPAHYTCTCPAFKGKYTIKSKNYLPCEQISCLHLERLLGLEYEKERTKNKGRLPGHEETDYKKSQMDPSTLNKTKSITPPPTLSSSTSSTPSTPSTPSSSIPQSQTSSSSSSSSSSSGRSVKNLPNSISPSSTIVKIQGGSQSQSQSQSSSKRKGPSSEINSLIGSIQVPQFILENLGLGNDEESKKVLQGIIDSGALQSFEAMARPLAIKNSINPNSKRKRENRLEPNTNYPTAREVKLGMRADRFDIVMCAIDVTKDTSFDPEGWWWNEKLDGVRALWDGKHFWSRNGNHYAMPKGLIEKMPRNCWLDGELWKERDNFDELSGLCRSQKPSQAAAQVKFVCFDMLDTQLPFEDRFNQASDLIGRPKSVDEIVADPTPFGVFMLETKKLTERRGVSAKDQLDLILKEILRKGGEGVMCRKAGTLYEQKRSNNLAKIKAWYDAEALLVGYQEGAADGRWVGKVGSLILLMENSKPFTCGSGLKDVDHHNPPKIGSIIRYKFQELSQELTPRFPIYQGVCPDKTRPKDAVVRTQLLRATTKRTVKQKDEEEPFKPNFMKVKN